MITDIYNRAYANNTADNSSVVDQGGLTKQAMAYAHSAANTNQAPSLSLSPSSSPSTSLAKTVEREDNPVSQEMISDGLGALFGAATGLDGIEMIIDYGCDAMEFYDEFVQDRAQAFVPQAPQPDPRLWSQPMPGMTMAA